jgi:very-short-patch-repair endonuclease
LPYPPPAWRGTQGEAAVSPPAWRGTEGEAVVCPPAWRGTEGEAAVSPPAWRGTQGEAVVCPPAWRGTQEEAVVCPPAWRGTQGEAVVNPKDTIKGVADREKVRFAREQRKDPTRAERVLWEALRRKQFGVRFRRQHPIGHFVLDFYCAKARLAVEVDGPLHDEQEEYDRWRDEQLVKWGIEVLRVCDARVHKDLSGVLSEIEEALAQRL